MTKFHINAEGVPAVCKATKGNCPFGGASGQDNHYDTIEEAQAAADKQNESQFGLLGENKEDTSKSTVNISKATYDEIFYDAADNHGFMNIGLSNHDFNDVPEAKELLDNLPKSFQEKYKNEDTYVLVQENNIPALVDSHLLSKYGARDAMQKDEAYNQMIESAEKQNPNNVVDNSLGGKDFSPEYKKELSNYIGAELRRSADLEVNGTKVYVNVDSDFDVNWADKYANSNKVNISNKAYDEIFYDAADNHGYMNVGLSNQDFDDVPEAKELVDSLPASFHEKYENKTYALVKEDNIPALVDNHILSEYGAREMPEKGAVYNQMIKSAEKQNPNNVVDGSFGGKDFNPEYKKELSNFVSSELKKKSDLEVNGKKVYVSTEDELDVNWVDKMFNK